MEFNLGGAQVGFMACARAYTDERVHFFGTQTDNATGAVILEGTAEDFLT